MVRITIDSEQVQFNSQLMMDKKMWKDGGVVGRSATAVHLRTQIEKIKTDITRIYEREIENNRYPSPLKLKNIYLGIETKSNTLLTVFKKMNEEKQKEVGTSLSQNTYKKYDLTYRRLEEYIQYKFKKEKYKDIPLTEINEEFINGFRNFLRVDKKVGHNATSKMMQIFKKAVTRARNAGLMQSNPFTQPITFVQVDKGFLTMDELQAIMDKEIEVERLRRVRDVFVFSCWTGLAYIDVYLLKDENIQKYLDGNYWIISKRHKTGILINVRLLDIPLRILQKYKGKQPDHRALPMPSNQKMNAYLKELADICGIKKNLTYHMRRHTFATTATLTNGVSIESVSKNVGTYQHPDNTNLCEGNQSEKRERNGSPLRQASRNHEHIITRRTDMRTIERQLRAKQGAVSLNEKELAGLMKATFDTPRLEQVRDLFIFASFTGLHYQKLKALRKENIHTKYGQQWILMAREQADTLIHVPLLPVPQMIIRKYAQKFMDTDEVLPVPSNQRLNAYLKEIAEQCGIEKNMTMYLACHTFKETVMAKNGISAGTVCRMLGRFDLRSRHAYVTDRVIKREMDKVARNCIQFEKIAALYLLSTNKSVYCPTK